MIKYQRSGRDKKNQFLFCSTKCFANDRCLGSRIKKECSNCGKIVCRNPSEQKKCKSDRVFCNSSCAAKYNNTHKKHSTRRSKLEKYIEKSLIELYPVLEIHFNRKDAINTELDIYIPVLKLAFELNGIYHYEPIHGQNKLNSIQKNDEIKFQACIAAGISLCIIDTSQQKYFKEKHSKIYLDIIVNIINSHLK